MIKKAKVCTLDQLLLECFGGKVGWGRAVELSQPRIRHIRHQKKETMTELAKVESTTPYRKYTLEQIIGALEESRGLIAPAARKLGCARDTIRKYIDEYADVAQAKLDQREVVTDLAENALYQAILDREAWAVCFYLKCLAKDRGYTERAEVSGPGGRPVEIRLVYDE